MTNENTEHLGSVDPNSAGDHATPAPSAPRQYEAPPQDAPAYVPSTGVPAPPTQPPAAAFTPPSYPQPVYPPLHPGNAPQTNSLSVVSLVLGIVGFFTVGILSVGAVITGHMALNQIKKTAAKGRGLAVAGLITGYIGSAILALFVVGWLFLGITALTLFGAGVSSYGSGSGSDYGYSDDYSDYSEFQESDDFYDEWLIAEETAIVTTLTGKDEVFWVENSLGTSAVCAEADFLVRDASTFGKNIVSGTVREAYSDDNYATLDFKWQYSALADCGYTKEEIELAEEAGDKASTEFYDLNR